MNAIARYLRCFSIIQSVLFIVNVPCPAQNFVQQEWVETFNGVSGLNDGAFAIGVDGAVYVTGISEKSPGIFKIMTVKYSPQGDLIWAVRYLSPGGFSEPDFANDIAVDSYGNVYIAGSVAIGNDGRLCKNSCRFSQINYSIKYVENI